LGHRKWHWLLNASSSFDNSREEPVDDVCWSHYLLALTVTKVMSKASEEERQWDPGKKKILMLEKAS
jgi:hypothetical protein